jgi:hypothetical protein
MVITTCEVWINFITRVRVENYISYESILLNNAVEFVPRFLQRSETGLVVERTAGKQTWN